MRWPAAGSRPWSRTARARGGPPGSPRRWWRRSGSWTGRGCARPPSPPRPGCRRHRCATCCAPAPRAAGSGQTGASRPCTRKRRQRRLPASHLRRGRAVGLDRAPEVKPFRRKIGELAAAGKAADLQMTIARHRARARPGELGFMYIDGHTRAYFGKRDVQKMHVARLKFPGPATEETWVTDGAGDPLLVVMAEPSSSLAAQIKELLPRLREIAGPDRKPTLCFDRGGWSPDLFAEITAARFHLLTYRTASPGEDIPDLPADAFTTAAWAGDDGREHRYELADGTADITVTKSPHKGRS